MRTTVTLDPDVAALIKRIMRERGLSFKQVLNSAVRAGLSRPGEAQPYRTPTRRLGARPGVDLDRALSLASALEDEEITRKLETRK